MKVQTFLILLSIFILLMILTLAIPSAWYIIADAKDDLEIYSRSLQDFNIVVLYTSIIMFISWCVFVGCVSKYKDTHTEGLLFMDKL